MLVMHLRDVSPACSAVAMMCLAVVTRASTLSLVDSQARERGVAMERKI